MQIRIDITTGTFQGSAIILETTEISKKGFTAICNNRLIILMPGDWDDICNSEHFALPV